MSLQHFVAHRAHLPDDTIPLALEGYAFISNRCRELGTDAFETRIMLQRTICMLGVEAARVFYDGERMQREGAAALRPQAMLLGRGGVQSLDGDAHHARKQLYLTLLSPAEVTRLGDRFATALRSTVWPERVVLFDAMNDLLARVVCEWAGVQLDEDRRIADITSMIEGPGAVGPLQWRGRVGRARAEWWMGREIERARARGDAKGALAMFAATELDARTAAVELLSVIRPTIAVARYITFCALALHDHPRVNELVMDDGLVVPFVQEVRRFYPFFPAAAARVRAAFRWRDIELDAGTRVLLDLYGTNHDGRAWQAPDEFVPERFVGWPGDPFTLIPQGGGDVATGHRCPGERLTIELMTRATRFLTHELTYDVPAQDLRVSLAKIPALPASRFVIANPRLE